MWKHHLLSFMVLYGGSNHIQEFWFTSKLREFQNRMLQQLFVKI